MARPPEGANVEAWLVTIAHRKAIDVVRARQRRPVTVVAIDGLQERASGVPAGRSRGHGSDGGGRGGSGSGSGGGVGGGEQTGRASRGDPWDGHPRAVRSQPGHPDHDDALDLWRAVGALPEKQRLAVAYHYLGGLAFADVADLIGGSVEAARRASSDGVRSLRASYAVAADTAPVGPAGHPLLHAEGLDR